VNREVNALYRIIDNNIDTFAPTVTAILEAIESSSLLIDSAVPAHLQLKSAYPVLKVVALLVEGSVRIHSSRI
jgi:hypothetical protein